MNAVVLVIVGLAVLFFLALAIGLIIYFVTRKSSPGSGLTDLNKPNGGGPVNPPTCKCNYINPIIPRPPRIPVIECHLPIGFCEPGTTQNE